MKKRNREILLAFARFLDRRAAGIRAFVKRVTPKRERRTAENAAA